MYNNLVTKLLQSFRFRFIERDEGSELNENKKKTLIFVRESTNKGAVFQMRALLSCVLSKRPQQNCTGDHVLIQNT